MDIEKEKEQSQLKQSKRKLFSTIKEGTYFRTTNNLMFVVSKMYTSDIEQLDALYSEEKFYKNHVVDLYDVANNKFVFTFIMYDHAVDSIYFCIELINEFRFKTFEIEELL